jgi:hypothetical protein
MAPLLIMFGERPLVDCIEKVDGIFVVDLGSRLGHYRVLVHYFARF